MLNVSAHGIRHTTLTWVERNFSYVNATVHDVATALSALTDEPHPLAN
jgi:integrase/recombinase XerC